MNALRCVSSVAVVMSAASLGLGGPAEAQVADRTVPTAAEEITHDSGDLEAFRADLAVYVQEMRAVARAAGLRPALPAASRDLPALTTSDLSVLQAAFARSPKWKEQPRVLRNLLRKRPRYLTQITADDCPAARSWGYTQTDIEIAADVALAADVILEAIPQDTLSAIARAVAVGIWAVPQGVLRGFEHLYNIAQACDAADFEAGVDARLNQIIASLADLQDAVDDNTQRLKSVQAVQRQIIRLELTPQGQRAVNPDVLTCTGDDCPAVLACPGDECSFPIK
jgi:hypothetical protein